MIFNPFAQRLREDLDKVQEGIFDRLEQFDEFSEVVKAEVVRIILSLACQCQNMGNIQSGRDAFQRLPPQACAHYLDALVTSTCDLNDEWEYLRFMELLLIVAPQLTEQYIALGLQSTDEAIQESAAYFINCEYRNGNFFSKEA